MAANAYDSILVRLIAVNERTRLVVTFAMKEWTMVSVPIRQAVLHGTVFPSTANSPYTGDMASATVLDRIFDPLSDVFTPETARRLAAWRADDETQRRLDELGDKSNEGALTATEREEYETYVRAIDFIGILQAKARAVLQRHSG